MNKFLNLFRREQGYAGIVESLVGSIITLIAMMGTALAINHSLQTTLSAQNYTKAASYIQEVFATAKNTNYNALGISLEGGENNNTYNINNKDISGCSSYLQTFENEYHDENLAGLPYCQIKAPAVGQGINFNVETHVTKVGAAELSNDFLNQFSYSNTLYAKRVTVIVTWWEGDRDANKLPILREAQAEILITPSLGFCPPATTGLVGGCNN